jgi:hypothetical protein
MSKSGKSGGKPPFLTCECHTSSCEAKQRRVITFASPEGRLPPLFNLSLLKFGFVISSSLAE